MPMTSKTVIFLHIPKTGGTTIYGILGRNYARREILTLDGVDHQAEIDHFSRSSESNRARYRLIQGHLHFGLHRCIPGDSTYVTCVRDPIARVLSFYSYARTHSDHYLYPLLTRERLGLKALLERNSTPELFNHQTCMIAGNGSDPACGPDRSALENAKENLLRNFCFVGVTEEFDASVILLSRMFGWDVPYYVKRNVTSAKLNIENIDSQTRALLRDTNALDLELYQFARTLFEAKRHAAGDAFESELRRFQRLNSVRTRMHKHCGTIKDSLKSLVNPRDTHRLFAGLKQTPADPSI